MAEETLEVNKKSRIFLAQITFSVSIVLFFVKYWAYHLTQSQAVLSDAMETIVNIVASALALWVIYWAAQPADKGHPYGHGKAEFLSAAFEGGLIFIAALVIIGSAVQALFYPHALEKLDIGIYITIAAAAINGVLGWFLIWRGKQIHSSALQASGSHLLSDLITSAGAVVGLILVIATGYMWIDPLIAILVALSLLRTGFKIMKTSLSSLLDAQDKSYLKQFNGIINDDRPDGIIQIHHVRMIISGDYHHVDAHVVLPEYWDIKRAHDSTIAYEKTVFKKYDHNGEIHFHIDPCMRKYCQFCPVADCPVRQEPFQYARRITLEEMINTEEPIEG